jgi:hypothetical protein
MDSPSSSSRDCGRGASGSRPSGVIPIRTEDYPTRATCPRNSRLDLSRLARVFGTTAPQWKVALAPELDRLAGRDLIEVSARPASPARKSSPSRLPELPPACSLAKVIVWS